MTKKANHTSTPEKRLPKGTPRALILDAAEIVFGAEGFDRVTFRDLAGKAGVSVSAINYHFGSKEGVLKEVFARRSRRLVERRAQYLDQLPVDNAGKRSLTGILQAFLRPAFEVTKGDRDHLFTRLLSHLSTGSTEQVRALLKESFDENDRRFIKELSRSASHLSPEDIHWRFHFLVGAMIYTMSDADQLDGLSDGLCSATDHESALKQMVSGFSNMFFVDPAQDKSPETPSQ
ncbi:Transcriptional regulator, TetR family [Sulfitobacter geojensis]|nr:Transcriptional regulator, TetR family [Sulfitobacter geojensis]